jgi:hypothetical protein
MMKCTGVVGSTGCGIENKLLMIFVEIDSVGEL